MKKIYLLAILSFLSYGNSIAQPAEMADPTPTVTGSDFSKKFFIGTGLAKGTFQNTNFSDTQFGDIGATLHIGFQKRKEGKLWETAITLNALAGGAKEYEQGASTTKSVKIYYKHLRRLKNGLYVGGRMDLIDFYLRNTPALGNNASQINTGSHLYGSLVHDKRINDHWNLESSFDLGLLSLMRSSSSFAFSSSQNILENGEFDYQNTAASSPFGLKYFEMKSLFKHINIKTSLLFQYKKRITLGYLWNVSRVAQVKHYPMTIAQHNIVFRFNITNKTEQKIKK